MSLVCGIGLFFCAVIQRLNWFGIETRLVTAPFFLSGNCFFVRRDIGFVGFF